jgi:hypothetical protein
VSTRLQGRLADDSYRTNAGLLETRPEYRRTWRNHYNRDRGDCLDYTRNPENNLLPGQHNLDLLEKLYGTPSRPLNANTSTATANYDAETRTATSGGQTPTPDYIDRDQDKNENDKDTEKDDRRHLLGRQSYLRHGHRMMAANDSALQVDNGTIRDDQAFLQESIQKAMDHCKHEHCVYDLNEKYQVRVQKLLAVVSKGAK